MKLHSANLSLLSFLFLHFHNLAMKSCDDFLILVIEEKSKRKHQISSELNIK